MTGPHRGMAAAVPGHTEDNPPTMQLPASIVHVVVPPVRNAAASVDMRPLDPMLSGRLSLATADSTGRLHVSAASGLATAGGAAWVVSDEYGELARFDELTSAGTLLPGLAKARKKPDLESLVRIPDEAGRGSLLVAFGSGSAKNRDRALVQSVNASGAAVGAPVAADLAPLFAALDGRLPLRPNFEGLALRQGAQGAELLLFHRGKTASDVNMVFRLHAARTIAALRAGAAVPADVVLGQAAVDLGMLDGDRLGFADARTLPDGRIAFVASAEGSDATGDGPIKGSVVGILDSSFAVQALRPLSGPARKVEGLELTRELDRTASPTSFTLVTDPDDPTSAAEVLTVDVA